MTTNRIDFQAALKKAVIPKLLPLGYQKMHLSEKWRGAPITFFQKHLFENFYGYIQFQIAPWTPNPIGCEPMQRSFYLYLVRNIGEEPDPIPRKYPFYLFMPVSYLLWNIFDFHKYESMYHEWNYLTKEELINQLEMATDDLLSFGIPYLEDLNSKNPFMKSGNDEK